MSIFTTRVLCRVDLGRYTEKPVVSVETNTAPTFGIFGILSSVFGIFRYCKYRRRYRYRYLNIGSVFWYTDPIRSLSSPAKDRRSANCSTQPTGTVLGTNYWGLTVGTTIRYRTLPVFRRQCGN